jgi:hypothetical protein
MDSDKHHLMNAHLFRRLSFWMGFAALLMLASRMTASAAATGDQPKILAVNTVGSNVVVRVQVPAGTRRLTIEGRPKLAQGNWTPRSVVWTDGSAGETTVTFAARPDLEMLRASTDDVASLPLPISFYSGSTNITPLISASAPNTGTAPTANTPGGALDTVTSGTGAPSSGATVVESDIWNIDGTTLYYFNQMRGLQVVDLSKPRIWLK